MPRGFQQLHGAELWQRDTVSVGVLLVVCAVHSRLLPAWRGVVGVVVRRYCPGGSSEPLSVGAGFYSLPAGGSVEHRTARAACRAGEYCEGGARSNCSAGTISNQERRSSPCTAPCPAGVVLCLLVAHPPCDVAAASACHRCFGVHIAGYFCPNGTSEVYPTISCFSATTYCPSGSRDRQATPPGHYAVAVAGSNPPVFGSERECQPGTYCEAGVRKSCSGV
jgi:hypothetical protein